MTDEKRAQIEAVYKGGDRAVKRSELAMAVEPMASDLQPNAPETFTPEKDVIEPLKSGGFKVVARAGGALPIETARDLGLVAGIYDVKR